MACWVIVLNQQHANACKIHESTPTPTVTHGELTGWSHGGNRSSVSFIHLPSAGNKSLPFIVEGMTWARSEPHCFSILWWETSLERGWGESLREEHTSKGSQKTESKWREDKHIMRHENVGKQECLADKFEHFGTTSDWFWRGMQVKMRQSWTQEKN